MCDRKCKRRLRHDRTMKKAQQRARHIQSIWSINEDGTPFDPNGRTAWLMFGHLRKVPDLCNPNRWRKKRIDSWPKQIHGYHKPRSIREMREELDKRDDFGEIE